MRKQILLISTILALTSHEMGWAQSLADVAAAEAARRQAQTTPAKVYTNDDLGSQQGGSPAPAAAASVARAPEGSGKPAASISKPGTTANPGEAVDETKTEKYWRGRITPIQQSLARNKVLLEAMQSRINALNAQALSTDSPGQRAALQADLTTAVGEKGRLEQESQKQNKELIAIQEEARRANIPPGWLR